MSGGKKPTPVPKAKSAFHNVNQAKFESDFGSSRALREGNRVRTTMELADFLKPIPKQAGAGIESNLAYLQRSPQQQYEDAIGGNDPLYNILSEQTKRNTDRAIDRSKVDSYTTGTSNSTTAGAAMGTILNDALLRSNNDLLQAIGFGNEQGRANLGANLNTLGSMANLLMPAVSMTNANLMQALGAQDAMTLANLETQMQNAKRMDAYNQQKSAGLGKVIGTGLSLGLAPFTGGASLMSIPSMWGGGGGGGFVPKSSYGFGSSPAAGVPSLTSTAPISLSNHNFGYGFGTPLY